LEDGWPVKLFEHYDLDRFKAFMKAAEGGITPSAG
jgi:hypothetical protein